MSRAGQNTFSGVSHQADVGLLFLLESYQSENFARIEIEGVDWEDFTLFYSNRTVAYEVKWHQSISFSDVKGIVQKEIDKERPAEYSFVIACKKLGTEFRKDYQYLKRVLPYWGMFFGKDKLSSNKVLKKFIKKGWSVEQITRLVRTDIVELQSEENLKGKVFDHFARAERVYLELEDVRLLTSDIFSRLIRGGGRGESFTRDEVRDVISTFCMNIGKRSESFDPEFKIKETIEKLDSFLDVEDSFLKLDSPKYLTVISVKPRHIHYICDEIEGNRFKFKSILFFLEKVLLKKAYLFSLLRILKSKVESDLIKPTELLAFLDQNLDAISFDDHFIHDSIEMLHSLVTKLQDRSFNDKVLKFLTQRILMPSGVTNEEPSESSAYSRWKLEHLPALLQEIGSTLDDEEQYLDLLFSYYRFVSVFSQGSSGSAGLHLQWMKNYLKKDVEDRLPKLLRRVKKQFKDYYGLEFKGAEVMGGGVGWGGYSFSLNESSLVSQLFRPLFSELYNENPSKTWNYFKRKIFVWPRLGASSQSPIFFKRAIIPICLEIVSGKSLSSRQEVEAWDFLNRLVTVRKGLPEPSEAVFSYVRGADLTKLDKEKLRALIDTDLTTVPRFPYPRHIFLCDILMQLLKLGESYARDRLLRAFGSRKFRKTRVFSDLVGYFAKPDVVELGNDDLERVVKALDLPEFIGRHDEPEWIDSRVLANLFNKYITSGLDIKTLLSSFLDVKNDSGKAANYFGRAISVSTETTQLALGKAIQGCWSSKKEFHEKFQDSPELRAALIEVGHKLVKSKDPVSASKIVELLIDDNDPPLKQDREEFDYHLQVKKGVTPSIITSVRGHLTTLLEALVYTKEVEWIEFAYTKALVLLDLDSSQAKRLSNSENHLFIALLSMRPLGLVATKFIREKLKESKSSVGNDVVDLTFKVLDWIDDGVSKGRFVAEALANGSLQLSGRLIDLDSERASRLLKFYLKHGGEDSAYLFIYFALVRPKQDESFNPKDCEALLAEACGKSSKVRSKVSHELSRLISNSDHPDYKGFEIESALPYVEQLVDDYAPRVYCYVSFILEELFERGIVTDKTINLLRSAVDNEINGCDRHHEGGRLQIKRILKHLKADKPNECLSIIKTILGSSDFKLGTVLYPFQLHDIKHYYDEIVETGGDLDRKLVEECSALFDQLKF